MTTMPTIKNEIKPLRNTTSENYNTIWVCYRCNLTFHEESTVSIHNDITKHSARKIEFLKGDLKVVAN